MYNDPDESLACQIADIPGNVSAAVSLLQIYSNSSLDRNWW